MTSLPPPPPPAVIPPPPPPPPEPWHKRHPWLSLLLGLPILPFVVIVYWVQDALDFSRPNVDITRNDPMWDRRDYTCGRRPFSNADSDGSGMG